jgi:hypothetical protein
MEKSLYRALIECEEDGNVRPGKRDAGLEKIFREFAGSTSDLP